MIFDYKLEKHHFWIETDSIIFERKLENETAFDGIIKIYSIRTNDLSLNIVLEGMLFGDFIYSTKKGVFLRSFKTKTSWPNTSLVYLNFSNNELTEIKNTNSSWSNWTVKNIGINKYEIEISPNKKIECEIDL